DLHYKELESIAGKWKGFVPHTLFQIMTWEAVAEEQCHGGNIFSLREDEAPCLNLIYTVAWRNEADDDGVVPFVAQSMTRSMARAKHESNDAVNYASEYQYVIRSNGEKRYAEMNAVSRKYDPEAIFQDFMVGYYRFGGPSRKYGPGALGEE
ncbi:hypothetical protein B0J11DRAFT_428579, partial [Dendryphion nanum]